MWKKLNKETKIFYCILLAYLVYAGVFIYNTSFVIAGERFFSLFDDAMISMRFARNLADGYGVVWNPGDVRVEGFTNPLWVAYMAFLHLLPIAQSKISLFVQMTSALLLTVNLILVRRIASFLFPKNSIAIYGALVLTALYLPLNNWSLQGMEVGAIAVLISGAILLALKSMDRHTFSYWLYILLGIGTLIRFDVIVPSLAIIAFLTYADKKNRWKHFFIGTGILAVFMITQTGIRYWYYGEFLPNTYYLKMTGYPLLLRMSRGAFEYMQFAWGMNIIFFLVPIVTFLMNRKNLQIGLLFFLFLGQTAYSIYVGGDAWEIWGGSNRYLCVAMPGFFILFAYGISQFFKKMHIKNTKAACMAIVSMFVLTILSINNIGVKPWDGIKEFLFLKKPFYAVENKMQVIFAFELRKITTKDASIGVVWAGALPYFADRNMVDLLGKNDSYIAHLPMHMRGGMSKYISFYPGHLKWDYNYSIKELQPDIIFSLWLGQQEILPFVNEQYIEYPIVQKNIWIKKDSANVRLH